MAKDYGYIQFKVPVEELQKYDTKITAKGFNVSDQ